MLCVSHAFPILALVAGLAVGAPVAHPRHLQPPGGIWPPLTAPEAHTQRHCYYIGASFSHTGTNLRAEGPRTAQWLSMLWARRGHVLALGGDPGDFGDDFIADIDKSIAKDVANNDMDDLQDCAVLEFINEALPDSVSGASRAKDLALIILEKLSTRAKRVYFIRYPDLEGADGTDYLYRAVPGLSKEGWNSWRDSYDAALEGAGYTKIDAYIGWQSSLQPVDDYPGALDYHVSSASAYEAALRIDAAVIADFDH